VRRSDVVSLNGPVHARAEGAKTDQVEALMRQITDEDAPTRTATRVSLNIQKATLPSNGLSVTAWYCNWLHDDSHLANNESHRIASGAQQG
jgi:hypothetical protein